MTTLGPDLLFAIGLLALGATLGGWIRMIFK